MSWRCRRVRRRLREPVLTLWGTDLAWVGRIACSLCLWGSNGYYYSVPVPIFFSALTRRTLGFHYYSLSSLCTLAFSCRWTLLHTYVCMAGLMSMGRLRVVYIIEAMSNFIFPLSCNDLLPFLVPSLMQHLTMPWEMHTCPPVSLSLPCSQYGR